VRGLVGVGRGGEDDAGWGCGFRHGVLPVQVYEVGLDSNSFVVVLDNCP